MRTLFVVRHAIAFERGEDWPDDDLRPLTDEGKARMRRAVAGLAELGAQPQLVLTSPLVRARETGEILAAGWRPAPEIEVLDALAPGHSPPAVARALGQKAGAQTVAVVGHEPDLGELVAWLIGAAEPLPFKKGGVSRIAVDLSPARGNGQLIWHATPRMLRAMGSGARHG